MKCFKNKKINFIFTALAVIVTVAVMADKFMSAPYATVNAFNLNFLAGANFADISTRFLFVNFSFYDIIFTIASAVIAIYIAARKNFSLPFAGGLFLYSVFTLTSRMHARDLTAVIILFLLTFLAEKDKRILKLIILTSTTFVINIFSVYLGTEQYSPVGILTSFANICGLVYAYRIVFPLDLRGKPYKLYLSKKYKIIPVLTVIALYSFLAFYGIGDRTAPQTNTKLENNQTITVKLEKEAFVGKLSLYHGNYLGSFNLFYLNNNGEYTEVISNMEFERVFGWQEIEINKSTSQIALVVHSLTDRYTEINEIGLKDKNNIPLEIKSVSTENIVINTLFDEQHLIPDVPGYKNSTYFDEIYHARTAKEFVDGTYPYENTHPHLGKLIMSMGIRIFGFNPFGYRFFGVIFGILILPLVYLFAKKLFNSCFLALTALILAACDFMHLAHSRIATIDVYVLLFILASWYFMYMFLYNKKVKHLFLAGLFFGLSAATKWTGFYSGAGLFIVYLSAYYKKPIKEMLKLTAYGFIFFVIIPFGVYFASFIPFLSNMGMEISFKNFFEANLNMLSYHQGVTEPHPYSSRWYEWILNLRPIWLFGGENSTIASMGNPIIWTGGLGALILSFKRLKDKKVLFLLIGYFSQIIPWFFVSRVVFVYHYFPSALFLVFIICSVFENTLKEYDYSKKTHTLCTAFTVCAVILFMVYYPVLTGTYAEQSYINTLRLIPRWMF